MSVSPVCVLVSPLLFACGPVEWRVCVLSCCPLVSCCPCLLHGVPCLRIRSGVLHCPVPLALHSLVLCRLFLLGVAVLLCGEWEGGVCGGRRAGVSPCSSVSLSSVFLSHRTHCVCCHSVVGLGLCLCDRVVSLWNSGDGLCRVEGRVVFTVHTSSCVVCISEACVL